ncbi:Tn3 family transposase [Actinomadura decatromicini]|uniref:Tn3 family transposase n=1 Tax=Actinomadura decatromicini TaxID=2604572 RepID=UPI003CCC65FF
MRHPAQHPGGPPPPGPPDRLRQPRQLRQRYREGVEDQLGALGLALNAVLWWNTLYLDAAVKQIRADRFPATDDMCARLSPIAYEHINFLGRYAFTRADADAGLRPFHDPAQEADASDTPTAAPTPRSRAAGTREKGITRSRCSWLEQGCDDARGSGQLRESQALTGSPARTYFLYVPVPFHK